MMTPKEIVDMTSRCIDEILDNSERLKMLESDVDDLNSDIASIYTRIEALEKSTLALTETITALVNLTSKLIERK